MIYVYIISNIRLLMVIWIIEKSYKNIKYSFITLYLYLFYIYLYHIQWTSNIYIYIKYIYGIIMI